MLNPLKNMLCLEVNSVFKHHSRLQVQYPSDKETTVRDFLGEKIPHRHNEPHNFESFWEGL